MLVEAPGQRGLSSRCIVVPHNLQVLPGIAGVVATFFAAVAVTVQLPADGPVPFRRKGSGRTAGLQWHGGWLCIVGCMLVILRLICLDPPPRTVQRALSHCVRAAVVQDPQLILCFGLHHKTCFYLV
jgi:hypothetical protein